MNAQKIFHPKFFDKNGNLKANSGQDEKGSENPNTINNVAAIMADKLGINSDGVFNIAGLNAAKRLTNGGKYFTKEHDLAKYQQELKDASYWDSMKMRMGLKRSSNRFSHDETNGVSVGSFYGMTNDKTIRNEKGVVVGIKPMTTFKEFSQHEQNLYAIDENTKQTFYRPYDVGAATKYAKSYFREAYQGNNDKLIYQIGLFAKHACSNTDVDTQGRYVTSGKQQAWLRVNGLRLTSLHHEMTLLLPEANGWVEVFSVFYPEEDHPINIMARMLYEN